MLKGKFHVHLTIENESPIKIKSWKQTIVLLSKENRSQLDIMFTKHYFVPSIKTKTVDCIKKDVAKYVDFLEKLGVKVVRVKLEHESLPTNPPSVSHYRECHIKVFEDKLQQIPDGFVKSQNPVEKGVYFINKRWYSGGVDSIQKEVESVVTLLGDAVKEVKVESIVYDTNKQLDKWWA